MKEIQARGPNFVFAEEFIKQTYGETVWNAVLTQLPPEAAEVWANPILITGTYSFQAFKELVKTLALVVGALTNDQNAMLYEYIADRSLNSVYKIFFRFANPSFVLKNYPKLWQRFFTGGTVEVPTAEKGHAIVTFTLPHIFLDWLPSACYGYSKKAVEMAGGKDLRIQKRQSDALENGWWQVVYELFWTE